jgi:hypothetical protein
MIRLAIGSLIGGYLYVVERLSIRFYLKIAFAGVARGGVRIYYERDWRERRDRGKKVDTGTRIAETVSG